MLELDAAVTRILNAIPPPAAEDIPLAAADDRVLLQRVISPLDLPPFDNSSMDGYAVRAADVAGAKPDAPVRLRLAGRVVAGATFAGELGPGGCVRLFTGSPLPKGADAVVMQEDTRIEPEAAEAVSFLGGAEPGENVRCQGEDVKRGATLAEAGEVLSPGRLSLLAATGAASVRVGRQPAVALVATGSELAEAGQPLAPGRIYESNRLGLAALIRRSGGIPTVFPLVADSLVATSRALGEALQKSDLVLTSGGVSVGEMDFIKDAFEAAGGELQFWKVAMKPGRPFVFGRHGTKLLFGLPGNPVSALVTFLLLVRPALLRWQGASDVALPASAGTLVEPLVNSGERRHFMRVKVDAVGRVRSAGLQASHGLSSLAAANGMVDVPPRTTLPAGEVTSVLKWA